jgi:RND superfamily putative drug exporter
MTRLLHRLGHTAAAHPWRTISAWVVLVAAAAALAATFGGTPQDNWDVPDASSTRGTEMLRDHLPAAGNATARVVVHDTSGDAVPPATLTTLSDRLGRLDHVIQVSPPRMSEDGDTALIDIGYDVPVTDTDLMGDITPLEGAIAPTQDAGLQVELGGELPDTAAAPMEGRGELIGVAAALFILVLAFGSVVAAGLPVATALVGLGLGTAGITLLAATTEVSTTAPTVATMVGLGVGIDYALLLVSRHVEFLRIGHTPVDAAAQAVATSGRSVVFAAGTVLVSLTGLRLAGLPTYSSFGTATGIAVVAVAATALVVVPALCRLAGPRLLPRRTRRGRSMTRRMPLTATWARRVARRPVVWALAASALMLALAVPALDMRTWPQDPSSQSTEQTTRRAHDLVTAEYGPGANAPLLVVLDRTQVTDAQVDDAHAAVEARADIASTTPVQVSPDHAVAVFAAEPTFEPADARTSALVDDLRADLPAGGELTGWTASMSDVSEMLSERLWTVIAFVVGVSVLLLAMVFRSVVLPLKAAAMNVLSVAAAYGVLTAIFQWGWGSGLLGLDHTMPVSSWMPILLFAILFGLSMDYEVFLLSRIRERWLDTGDARSSVVEGLTSTGRVITSAAAIMVAVFLGFASEADVVVKQIGVGMAAAILLDATVVRMVLVPASMTLLGRWNWWLPGWLDRFLPEVHAEAPVLAEPTATPTTTEPATDERTPARV